jgi:dipeptidyl aminopeptidase/acylaminoacyl peptidase
MLGFRRRRVCPSAGFTTLVVSIGLAAGLASAPASNVAASQPSNSAGLLDRIPPDFVRMRLEQAATDRAWRLASSGYMRMDKITYRSRAGGLNIPAFVFQPLHTQAPRTAAALIWIHENIRGHLYEHYIPYVREATSRGYVVIAPEYRGSIGYGQSFYDAIDYGGAEVDDVVSAANALATQYPEVNPARLGIIGWSHGGLIGMLALVRNPTMFRAGAAIVPVSNLLQRIALKGDRQRIAIDPQNRFGGPPSERHEVYVDRSPLFQVEKLRAPLLVHVAENDQDVNIEESRPLVDALRARKPALSETKIYKNPAGGHLFDRLVDPVSWLPQNTDDQRDSWIRVWGFFERHLVPAAEQAAAITAH